MKPLGPERGPDSVAWSQADVAAETVPQRNQLIWVTWGW